MLKRTLLFLLLLFIGYFSHAQSADSVYNQYLDFNLARFQGEQDKVLTLGEAILPNADKLPEKARINFYFSVGKMYEDDERPEKALPYYLKVADAVPDYYVVHRALGYIYYENSKAIALKRDAAKNDKKLHDQLSADYVNAVKKTLPHLEKAQACDPSNETLDIIKTLYQNIKDAGGLSTLDNRLKELSKHCIDILTDT
jgi:tetratricopeptide (TPR) repeat protein